jgi:hypothetical protein
MPPRGESIGHALEDAIIFAHVLSHYVSRNKSPPPPPADIFTFYESIRLRPIDAAYADASLGWDSNKDSGWLFTKFMEWVTPIYLWWTSAARKRSFETDPREIYFPADC